MQLVYIPIYWQYTNCMNNSFHSEGQLNSLNVDHVDDDVDGVDCDDGCGEGSGRRSIMMMVV